mgnify:CR=1 FL=1
MLKKKRFTLFVLTSLLGLGLGQRVGADEPPALIQLSPEAQQAAADGRFNSLKKIESILAAVSALRQLPVLAPVKLTVISRTSLQAELAEKIKTEIPPQKIRGEEALYRQLGMISHNFDYGAFMLDLYTEQIGGFYDPKTQALNLIEGTPMTGIEQEMLIAHELTHALQDQHYHLDDLLNAPERKDNDDATLALMSLVEGDATVSSMAYVQETQAKKPLQGFFSVLGSLVNQVKMMSTFKTFQSAPAFIQESLIFPYQQGSQFVSYFQNQAPEVSAIQGLYDRLPQSTEQILHPLLYQHNENPEPVQFDFKALFPQAEILSSSVWGELGYRQYLQRHLDWKEAKAAASGWAGDRYGILDTPEGPAFVFASLWDNVVEATEFRQAYHKTLALRTGKAPALVSPGLWWAQHDDLGNIFLYQDQSRVLVLEHVSQAFASHKQFQQVLEF